MYSRGFQIDNFVFQSDLNFANLKRPTGFISDNEAQKLVCSLILQNWGHALEKRLGSIIVDSTPPNCIAVVVLLE